MNYELEISYEIRDIFTYFNFIYKRKVYMITIQKVKNKEVYFFSTVNGVKTNKSIHTFTKREGALHKKGIIKLDLEHVYRYELGALECMRKFDTEKSVDRLNTITELFETQLNIGLKNTKSDSWDKSIRFYNVLRDITKKMHNENNFNHLGYLRNARKKED